MQLLFLVCFLQIVTSETILDSLPYNEDASLSIPEIIEKHGYQCEEFHVVTPDEYILRIHHIPPKLGVTAKNQTVFLMHGILSSSADWIILGPGKGLGYILADEGYDVWMGNARGNTQSRNHTHLDPDKDKAQFWDFSWHEIGYYDLPTMIDFVLEKTGHSDLIHIGHSQGTTTLYVMTSMRPEYNAKIKAHFSLAPIAYMNHMTSPLLQIITFWVDPLGVLLDLIGMYEFLPKNSFLTRFTSLLCHDTITTELFCMNSLFMLCGFSPNEMNSSLYSMIHQYTPAGSATKQLLHYGQETRSGYFRQYDYGFFSNYHRYGRFTPPSYDLDKITVPIYLFYSHNDWLSAEYDVLRLYNGLPNVQGRFLITDGSFNHLDYMYGIHAREYVYNRVISLMMRIKD